MRFNITINLPRCWIFHRYKLLSFFDNAFTVALFFYPGVNSFFINNVRVFSNFFKWTSVYLILYVFLVLWVISYYKYRLFILNCICLFVPVFYFVQCNLFFSRNIMSKLFLVWTFFFGFFYPFFPIEFHSFSFLSDIFLKIVGFVYFYCCYFQYRDCLVLFFTVAYVWYSFRLFELYVWYYMMELIRLFVQFFKVFYLIKVQEQRNIVMK